MLRGLRRCCRLRGVVAETARLRLCRHASTTAVAAAAATTTPRPRSVGIKALPSRTGLAPHKKPRTSGPQPSPQPSDAVSKRPSYSKLSDRAALAFKRAGIGFPGSLLRLPGYDDAQAKHGIALRVSRRHTWHPYNSFFLNPEGHPLQEKYISWNLEHTDQPLWFYSVPVRDQIHLPIVVKQSSTKARKAFRLALKAAGYDVTGRRLSAPDAAMTGPRDEAAVQELFGTVRLDYDPVQMARIPLKKTVEHLGTHIQRLEEQIGKKQRQMVKSQRPMVESQRPMVKSQWPMARSQKPTVKSHKPMVESQRPIVQSQKPIVKSQWPIVKSRRPI
ncbi:hypothetical protein GQ53DRAFT_750474 [Thozetella sp. PMI_491]|nr:hypothetical protein GQ53DRAFT_750474 [Thozetella sp. PMI_491]